MNKAQIHTLYARKLRRMARERRHDQRPEPLTAHGGRGVARAAANGATDGLPQKDFMAKASRWRKSQRARLGFSAQQKKAAR